MSEISNLKYDKAVLERALGMMSGRLFLCDNYENKPNWTYAYDKYIRYAKEEIDKEIKDALDKD